MDRSKSLVTGHVFNIQHFCVDDGPGIRTTVFFKGCPLHCVWCHNPESHEATNEIMFHADRCTACAACVGVCPAGAHRMEDGRHCFDRSQCTRCMACTDACMIRALEAVGTVKDVDEVLADVLSDRIFYKTSNGGVTLSGGEPTAQPIFAQALLEACKKEGLHTCLETCGWCKTEVLSKFVSLVDLFLLDWKLTDDTLHQKYTGVSNRLILENLAFLNDSGARVILRCPLIPGINTATDHLDGIAALANRFSCIEQIDLEPYHPMGIGKTIALGKNASYENRVFMDAAQAEDAKTYVAERTAVLVTVSGK